MMIRHTFVTVKQFLVCEPLSLKSSGHYILFEINKCIQPESNLFWLMGTIAWLHQGVKLKHFITDYKLGYIDHYSHMNTDIHFLALGKAL